MRKIFKLLSVSLLGALLSLLVLELSFAVFLPQETFAKRFRGANRCWQKDENLPVRPKPNCSYVLATSEFENEMQINSQGFRGPEVAIPKPADVTRIVITGDSFVFGSGVEEKNMLSTKVQEFLTEKNIFTPNKVEVINAGFWGGFSSDGHLLGIRKLIKDGLDPDMVIMTVFVFNEISDMDNNEWIGIADFSTPTKIRFKRFIITEDNLLLNIDSDPIFGYNNIILRNSNLAVFLHNHWPPLVERVKIKLLGTRAFVAQSAEPSDSQFYGIQSDDCVFGDRCHRRFVHLFSDLVWVMKAGQQEINKISKQSVNFLVVLIPVDFQIYADAVDKYGGTAVSGGIQYAYQNPSPQPQARLRKLVNEAAIPYLDLLPAFRKNSDPRKYYPIDGHWNELGTALAAEEIVNWVEDQRRR